MAGDEAPSERATSKRPGWLPIASIATRFLIIVLFLAIPGGIFAALQASKPVPPKASQDIAPPKVRVLNAELRTVQRSWVGYGQARAMDAVDVAALISAEAIERPPKIEDGVWVEAGTLLLRLDPEDFANQLAASQQRIASLRAQLDGLAIDERRLAEQVNLARAEADLARRELERVRQAVDLRAGTTTDIETRQSALSRAERVLAGLEQQADLIPTRKASLNAQILAEQATLANAELQLARSEIRAAISGFVQSITPEAGEFVPAGTMVARVVDPRRLEVPLRVPASSVASLRVGDRVELAVEGPGGITANGSIARIAPEAEGATRSATVFVELTQDMPAGGDLSAMSASGLVLPGQLLVGRLLAQDSELRVVVPRRVVADDRVLVVRDESGIDGAPVPRVQRADVRVLYAIELPSDNDLLPGETQWVVLGSGVQPGDRVVVSSLDELQSDNNEATVTSVLPRGRRVVPIAASGSTESDGPQGQDQRASVNGVSDAGSPGGSPR